MRCVGIDKGSKDGEVADDGPRAGRRHAKRVDEPADDDVLREDDQQLAPRRDRVATAEVVPARTAVSPRDASRSAQPQTGRCFLGHDAHMLLVQKTSESP